MSVPMQKSWFYLGGLLVLVGLVVVRVRSGRELGGALTPPSQPVPVSLFGMHIHHLTDTSPWPRVPFGAWRLWDAYAAWPSLEPEKGRWDFSRVDQYVSLGESHNVEVLLPLALSPTWASKRPQERSGYGPGNAAEPRDMSDWRNYVERVATRYKGRVHVYEIWNEPNLPDFFSGTPELMLQLAREAYVILKQVDKTLIVVSPSATSIAGVSWLDRYLRLGGGAYADVIGFHLYVTPEAPEAMVDLARRVRAVMAENHAAGKPLWNTESGWLIENRLTDVRPQANSYSKVLTLDEASAYVARCYVLNWALGIPRFYFYSWDSEVGGLTEADGKTLKPPATAYAEVEDWLVGTHMISCLPDGRHTWICELSRTGYRAWIVWNPTRSMDFQIPAAWRAEKLRDLSGKRRPLGPGSVVSIGSMPILLESGTS
jgi:Glycosyl hydrolases family 39